MITIIVSIITSLITTAGLYYVLHKANPTATQAAIDSAKTEVTSGVGAEVAKVEADVAAKV